MINRRYNIIRKLGEGGLGEVFLVEDIVYPESAVAMKIFSRGPFAVDQGEILETEFSLLAQLNHSHLLKVFEFDKVLFTDDERYLHCYFFTMEYLEGENAFNIFKKMTLGKEKIEMLEEVFIQTLSVLLYIHRQGIIHFDIKPENLMLIQQDAFHKMPFSTKLVDFGFSVKNVESLDIPLRGTLDYTAPEFLQGQSFDHRLDLYSLGVTFYHLWEGQCPYKASTPIDLLKKVIAGNYPPIQRRYEGHSILPNIIDRLCKKNPSERFDSVRDIFAEFASTKYEPLVKQFLFDTSVHNIVGRDNEKSTIINELDKMKHAQAGYGKTIFVKGCIGSGKSTLFAEAIKITKSKKLIVIQSQTPQSKSKPFSFVLSVLKFLELQLSLRGNISLKSTVEENTSEDSIPERIRHYTEYFEKVSEVLPFVLVIDDVQYADDGSIAVFKRLSELKLVKGRIVVLVTVDEQSKVQCVTHDNNFTSIVLHELSEGEVRMLFQLYFGEQFVASGFVENYYRRYGGNPKVAVEAVNSIGYLIPLSLLTDAKGIYNAMPGIEEVLSKKLKGFFVNRFTKMDCEQQRVLQLLSCFEAPCPIALLRQLIPIQEQQLDAFLHSLKEAEYIVYSDNETHLSVRHLILKEYIYRSITRERVELHGNIAARFESMRASLQWIDLNELARQYELSGNIQKARRFYKDAGDKAIRSERYDVAYEAYKKAIQYKKSEADNICLMIKLAEAYSLGGLAAESVDIYKNIMSSISESDTRMPVFHKKIGKGLVRLGENKDALNHFENALSYPVSEMDKFEIQEEIISINIAEGSFGEALKLAQAQKSLTEVLTDKQSLALVETDIGIAHFYKGDFQESLESFNNAFHIYRRCDNKEKMISSLMNIGNVLSVKEDIRGALQTWNKALSIATDTKMENQRARLHNNIGIAYSKLQEFDKARSHYTQAKNVFDELRSKDGIALTLTNLGEVEIAESDYESALNNWEEALVLLREMQDSYGIAQVLLEMAATHFIIGDISKVSHLLDEAESVIEGYNLETLFPLFHYLNGRYYLRSGNYIDAMEELHLSEKGFLSLDGAVAGGVCSKKDRIVLIRILLCEKYQEDGNQTDFSSLLKTILAERAHDVSPFIEAEMCYFLGTIARTGQQYQLEKPILYFRRGMILLEHQQVSEITWKLSYELANEYGDRGHREKEKESMKNAQSVIHYIASKFSSVSLREKYLSSNQRDIVLHKR